MEKRYSVSLEKYGKAQGSEIIYTQGDQNVYPIEINLLENLKPFSIPDKAEVFLSFQLPGSVQEPIRFHGEAKIKNAATGELEYAIIGSEISIPGRGQATVTVALSDKTLTWPAFEYTVLESFRDVTPIPPKPLIPWTEQIEQEIAELGDRIDDLEQSGVGGGIGEAPNDGQQYARQDKGWQPIAEITNAEIIALF